MFKILYDLQGVCHGVMALDALDVHHRADSAVVMLKLGTVQTGVWAC